MSEQRSGRAVEQARFIRWAGWALAAQIERLEKLAELCRTNNPARARELLAWARFLREVDAEERR